MGRMLLLWELRPSSSWGGPALSTSPVLLLHPLEELVLGQSPLAFCSSATSSAWTRCIAAFRSASPREHPSGESRARKCSSGGAYLWVTAARALGWRPAMCILQCPPSGLSHLWRPHLIGFFSHPRYGASVSLSIRPVPDVFVLLSPVFPCRRRRGKWGRTTDGCSLDVNHKIMSEH